MRIMLQGKTDEDRLSAQLRLVKQLIMREGISLMLNNFPIWLSVI